MIIHAVIGFLKSVICALHKLSSVLSIEIKMTAFWRPKKCSDWIMTAQEVFRLSDDCPGRVLHRNHWKRRSWNQSWNINLIVMSIYFIVPSFNWIEAGFRLSGSVPTIRDEGNPRHSSLCRISILRAVQTTLFSVEGSSIRARPQYSGQVEGLNIQARPQYLSQVEGRAPIFAPNIRAIRNLSEFDQPRPSLEWMNFALSNFWGFPCGVDLNSSVD